MTVHIICWEMYDLGIDNARDGKRCIREFESSHWHYSVCLELNAIAVARTDLRQLKC